MFDARQAEVGGELIRDVLASIIGAEGVDCVFAIFLKRGTKHFETIEQVALKFHGEDNSGFGEIIDKCYVVLVPFP